MDQLWRWSTGKTVREKEDTELRFYGGFQGRCYKIEKKKYFLTKLDIFKNTDKIRFSPKSIYDPKNPVSMVDIYATLAELIEYDLGMFS